MGYPSRALPLSFRADCKHVTVGVGQQHRNRSIDFRERRPA